SQSSHNLLDILPRSCQSPFRFLLKDVKHVDRVLELDREHGAIRRSIEVVDDFQHASAQAGQSLDAARTSTELKIAKGCSDRLLDGDGHPLQVVQARSDPMDRARRGVVYRQSIAVLLSPGNLEYSPNGGIRVPARVTMPIRLPVQCWAHEMNRHAGTLRALVQYTGTKSARVGPVCPEQPVPAGPTL